MFIETGSEHRPALQRSAMFRAMVLKMGFVSLRWSEGVSLEFRACYKHFVPTGRGTRQKNLAQKTRSCRFASQIILQQLRSYLSPQDSAPALNSPALKNNLRNLRIIFLAHP